MPEELTLPLQSVTPDEALDMCDITRDPVSLLTFLVRHLGVDGGTVSDASAVVSSASEPGAADRDKVWLKTSSPPGVGVFANGVWNIIYPYPPNVALPWVGSGSPPSYMRTVSDSEKANIGFNTSQKVVKLVV